MNIIILCVGKLKEKYWAQAVDEYVKRLSRYCTIAIDEVKESDKDDKQEEGESILRKIKKEDYVIALEVNGTGMSSEELANKIESLQISGKSKMVFVIGGSEGLSNDVSKRANCSLSFSKMTFPHQMMRVILLEQIYRSFKIIKNEKYHK